MDQLHPAGAPPNDTKAAFREYAISTSWTYVHIGQFVVTLLIVLCLLALSRPLSHQSGLAGASASVGAVTAVLAAAIFAVQMAVDGVALRSTVHAWFVAALGRRRPPPSRSPTGSGAWRRG